MIWRLHMRCGKKDVPSSLGVTPRVDGVLKIWFYSSSGRFWFPAPRGPRVQGVTAWSTGHPPLPWAWTEKCERYLGTLLEEGRGEAWSHVTFVVLHSLTIWREHIAIEDSEVYGFFQVCHDELHLLVRETKNAVIGKKIFTVQIFGGQYQKNTKKFIWMKNFRVCNFHLPF